MDHATDGIAADHRRTNFGANDSTDRLADSRANLATIIDKRTRHDNTAHHCSHNAN